MAAPVYGPAGHPHVPDWVVEELNRFDPNIWFMFSEYRISKRNGQVLVEQSTGRPFKHPRWHFWYTNPTDGKDYYLFEWNRDGEYANVDRGVLDKIKGDLLRKGYSLDWILRKSQENADKLQQKKEERFDQYMDDYLKANKRFFLDTMDGWLEKKDFYKDPTIYSYEGQTNRGTSTTKVKKSNKEIGLEKGDVSKLNE